MRNVIARFIIGTVITAAVMFAADSSAGTWKFNAAKSKTTSANPIKSRTDVREATADGGGKVTRMEVLKDGTTRNYSYTFKFDGKEYPVVGGPFDRTAQKRIDANTTTFETRNTGNKYHLSGRIVISSDGKTLTQTYEGTEADGKPITNTNVFDRQ
jgi:hypothetical protein